MSTLFIDNFNIYCFGRGLLVSMCRDIYQYRYFMNNLKLTLQMYEINNIKKFGILSLIFVDFNFVLIKPVMFGCYEPNILVADISSSEYARTKLFQYPRTGLYSRQYYHPPPTDVS